MNIAEYPNGDAQDGETQRLSEGGAISKAGGSGKSLI
jgi:hypothetical protein